MTAHDFQTCENVGNSEFRVCPNLTSSSDPSPAKFLKRLNLNEAFLSSVLAKLPQISCLRLAKFKKSFLRQLVASVLIATPAVAKQ
jgi:hypothetical protein